MPSRFKQVVSCFGCCSAPVHADGDDLSGVREGGIFRSVVSTYVVTQPPGTRRNKFRKRELRIATGEWMQDFVRRNSQRREKVFVPAAELVKKSIKRSWTISNPSGTARPPPIERFRRLPDVDNPSNSLPRIASKMAKDNNTYVASTYTLPPPPRSQSEEGRAMRPRRPRAMSLASEEYYARSQSEDSRRFDAGGEDSDGSSLFRPSRPQPRPPQHSPSFRSVQGPYSDDERFPRYAPPPHLRNRVEFLPNTPSRTQSEERPPVRKGVVRGSSFSLPRPAYDPASPTLRPPKPPRAHPPTVKRRASTSNLSEVARRNSHRSPPSIRHSGTEDTFESDASASSFSPTRRRRETVILREEFQARKEALLFQAQGSISTDEDPIYDRPVMPPRKRTPPPIAKRRSESFKELSHALRRRSSSASDSEEPSRNRARDRAKEIRRRESLSGPPPSNYRTELAVNLTVETCGPDSTAPASDSKPPRSTSSSSNASPRVHAAPAIVTTSAPDSSPDDSSSGRRKSKRDAQIEII
ncbi:unnamed protein product [Cyprideis torosa]|uniref:Uncharacterized protein n=1 Tax=Cyprideis torosa TaxID=163714 RepID=A0A7R8W1B0_9CRUS|nr:unnamed protein product [Cyprideis torosa]CAG0880723.1 unnamed protein product [Cyprideis torosa]